MNLNLLILFFVGGAFCEEDLSRVEDISNAVSSLISDFFVTQHSNINIIKMEDYQINCITTKIVEKSDAKFSYRIEDFQSPSLSQVTGRKKLISIILLDNINSLTTFVEHLKAFKFERKGFYLIFLLNGSTFDFERVFQIFWARKCFNVNILFDSTNNLRLLTFMPFTDNMCGDLTTKLINEFIATSKKWKNGNFYPKKFKNLHNCKLVHETTLDAVITSATGKYRGKEIEIIDELSSILNFSAQHIVSTTFGSGIKTGVLKNLMEEKIQTTAGSLQLSRTEVFSASSFFLNDPLVLIVPPGAPFTPMEILTRTFGLWVWIVIFSVFIIATLINVIVPKRFKLIFMRRNSSDLIFYMTAIFLGVSLKISRLPARNFSRILFTVFTFYALILRTAYIGILFQYLRTDVKHQEVSNVEEMIKHDFTFYAFESMLDRIVDFKFYDRFSSFL